jgi:hypothetical protein
MNMLATFRRPLELRPTQSRYVTAALAWAIVAAISGCSDGGTNPETSNLSQGGNSGSGEEVTTSASGGSAGTADTTTGSGGSNTAGGSGGNGGSTNNDQGDASAGHPGDSGPGPSDAAPEPNAEGFISIFNGQDLTGWVPLIHKSKVGENYMDTFRVDAVNHTLQVNYDKYPNLSFDDRCGNIYYDKFLTNYIVRVTYRFSEPQAKNPVSWGKNNSGLMIFALDPRKVTGDPEFPPLIEIQLLGTPSTGGSTSPNECEPGGMSMKQHSANCGNNNTGKPAAPAAQWTTVQAEVHVNGQTKVFQLPDLTTPVFTMMGPPTYQGQPVTGGYVTLQSESQPVEFKDVLLKELPQ